MSKIGKLPVQIPQGVTVTVESGRVLVSGPKGKLEVAVTGGVTTSVEGDMIIVSQKGKSKVASSIHGTIRAKIANAVNGVTNGFSRQLELVGTGYRAEVNGKTLVLTIGYSHPVKIEAPEGIAFKVEKNVITVDGADKEIVGQIAASVRAARPPEPYQGKGIKYIDEVIRRKAGKAAKTVGGTAA